MSATSMVAACSSKLNIKRNGLPWYWTQCFVVVSCLHIDLCAKLHHTVRTDVRFQMIIWAVFWIIMPYSLLRGYWPFGGMCCHHLQGRCWPWRWKKYVSPKCWCPPTRLHSVATHGLNYVNWFVFPQSYAWDWLLLLRSLFCCYFVHLFLQVSAGIMPSNSPWLFPHSLHFVIHDHSLSDTIQTV
jgi:hypothetical protein